MRPVNGVKMLACANGLEIARNFHRLALSDAGGSARDKELWDGCCRRRRHHGMHCIPQCREQNTFR